MNTTEQLAEALRNMVDLAEYWFNREDRRGFSADQYRTWHALGFGSNTVLNAREALRLYDEATALPVQDLPPLPEPLGEFLYLGREQAWNERTGQFTADQMHAYAREAMAATPAPAPLTDEQIKAEAMEAFDSSWDADDETLVNKYGHGVYLSRFIEFARAVERAHGIGKGKESA